MNQANRERPSKVSRNRSDINLTEFAFVIFLVAAAVFVTVTINDRLRLQEQDPAPTEEVTKLKSGRG